MPLKYRRRLLAHLGHDTYTPRDVDALADDLGVEDHGEFAEAVRQLSQEGLVEVTNAGMVRLPSVEAVAAASGGVLTGKFRRAPRGFGFVELEQPVREGSVFVPARATADAMTGDVVKIEIRKDPRRGGKGHGDRSPFTGVVVDVLERKRSNFAGVVEKRGSDWVVQPDGKQFEGPIVVRDAESKNVKPGDKVVVEITEFPEDDYLAEGVIVRVLGEAGRPDVETESVIAAYDLPPLEFPPACVDQARALTQEFKEAVERFHAEGPAALPDRRDLTGEFILTIDPPDAKDYDDAISIRRTRDGGWEVGVHIADVGGFIEAGSPLDEEARKRGNSVYLPRLVIPMLPEILSNGICSLQEGVERFSKSAFMSYDSKGRIRGQGVAQTIIRSRKRLTYLEAQALIDGDEEEAKKHARTEPNYTEELKAAVREMDACARAIRERRRDQGMISLELPDVELIFDENGRVIDAEPEDDAFTHTIIEMFMVEANEVLARLFEGMDVPLIRRVHPDPTPGDVEHLQRVAVIAGFRIPERPSREEMQGLLDATRGTPAARAVHMAVLRTLTKAEYSPALIGHFALASEAYAHFTSPIRRYPDLTVHRALQEYLRHTENGLVRPEDEEARKVLGRQLRESEACPSEEELVVIARHCTNTEQNAEDAEMELRKYLVLQLLEEKIGEEFEGVVTGVTGKGVFVQLDKYLVDGLIKKEDLPGDVTRSNAPPFWKLDRKTGALVDQRSGRSFKMGDMVRVSIATVDLARRQMDLVISDAASRAAGKSKAPKLTLGSGAAGGLGQAEGAGFEKQKMTGAQRRSRKSKSRDKRKPDYRRDKKGKK